MTRTADRVWWPLSRIRISKAVGSAGKGHAYRSRHISVTKVPYGGSVTNAFHASANKVRYVDRPYDYSTHVEASAKGFHVQFAFDLWPKGLIRRR